MPRWPPDTQERLVRAAIELFTENGYDATTVGDISERVGVTARTYFRYFPDKREVLFASAKTLHAAVVAETRRALASRPPYEALLIGITSSRAVFQSRELVRSRESLIATSEELRERERMKITAITAELRSLFLEAGVPSPTASMTAEVGVIVLGAAIRRWQDGDDTRFGDLVVQSARLLADTARLPDGFDPERPTG